MSDESGTDDRMDDAVERPWWLSSETGDANRSQNAGDTGASWDMTSMLGMVSSLAGQWWASSGASEHATHDDPAEHPDCVVCKGLLMLGSATRPPDPDVLPAVRWLPIRRA
jgi:hypothetical protein